MLFRCSAKVVFTDASMKLMAGFSFCLTFIRSRFMPRKLSMYLAWKSCKLDPVNAITVGKAISNDLSSTWSEDREKATESNSSNIITIWSSGFSKPEIRPVASVLYDRKAIPSSLMWSVESSSRNVILTLRVEVNISAFLKSLNVRSSDSLMIRTFRPILVNAAAMVRHKAVFPWPVSS
jgi:hypothetical protein